jgi:hypothetical protein
MAGKEGARSLMHIQICKLFDRLIEQAGQDRPGQPAPSSPSWRVSPSPAGIGVGDRTGLSWQSAGATMDTDKQDRCPDCGIEIGQPHRPGCDMEQCPYCGGQLLSCCCFGNGLDFVPQDDAMPWNGLWRGEAECREFGWFAKRGPKGWQPCAPDEPGAMPDFNRLSKDARWDRAQKRFVKKQ